VQHGDSRLMALGGVQEAKGIAAESVDHGVQIHPSKGLQAPHIERVSWANSSPGRLLST